MRDWLELELAEELRPTTAPDELWDRIQNSTARPARAPRREIPSWTPWPVAAVLTLAMAGGMLWLVSRHQESPAMVRQIAMQDPVAMSCTDPVRVHYWTAPERAAAHVTNAHLSERAEHSEGACQNCHTAL